MAVTFGRGAARLGMVGLLVAVSSMVLVASSAADDPPAGCSPLVPAPGQVVTCVFAFTGDVQTWTVPAGVTQATFDLYGAQGGGSVGGLGGRATASIAVSPGASIQVNVGGQGVDAFYPGSFNGGGRGGLGLGPSYDGAGGGGASDVRIGGTALADRALVAAGGGGGTTSAGGAGGGLVGLAGDGEGGGGAGTQSSAGTTVGDGAPAGFGVGGQGSSGTYGGGGGGGGWYGGGGGGSSGGGGGSGFGPVGTVFATGVRSGGGLVTITYTQPLPYAFSGFLQPVDNLPTLNSTKAGQAIPVKFSLGGNQGLNVLAPGYPQSQHVSCDLSEPVDAIEQTVLAGNSTLSYDASTDTYTYTWKTDKAWANTCRQLDLRLSDGSDHVANFQFKK